MRFAEPTWLWLGAIACALVCMGLWWHERRSRRALATFVAPRLLQQLTASVSRSRRRLKALAFVGGVACVFVALARPQWGYHLETRRTEGADIVFAVDTSRSMLTEDVRPSRLTRAKLAVEELVGRTPGGRLGLVAFAGDAFLQVPLTGDRGAFLQTLAALDSEIIPEGGSNIESAIRVAQDAFANATGRRKVLVLLSDGEQLEGAGLSAAREAATSGVRIHAIGVGTHAGGVIPVRSPSGQSELMRDQSGAIVRSRLDEKTLTEIAAATGGAYEPLGAGGEGLDRLYRSQLASLPTSATSSDTVKVHHERFQWPLAAALALLLVEWLASERRRRSPSRLTLLPAAALLSAASLPLAAAAQSPSALESYNRAAGSYRSGEFEEAAQGYRDSLRTRDLTLQQRAYYDLGNALYRQGQAARDESREQAIEKYKQAIASYEGALALRQGDEDARYNREVVRRALAQLEREEREQAPKSGQERKEPQGGQQNQDEQAEAGQQHDGQTSGQQNQDEQAEAGQQHDGQTSGQKNQDEQAEAGQQHNGQTSGQQNQDGQAESGQQRDEQTRGQPKHGGQAQAEQPHQDGEREAGQAQAGQASQEHEERDAPSDTQGDALTDQESAGPVTPGGLTRAEATRLLDSLDGDLQQLPSGYGQNKQRRRSIDRLRKDW